MATPPAHLSIGKLSSATGVAIDTIRAWERRYGRPQPIRLPSGHRRYAPADVPWLRQVAQAVALGHRPSKVIALDPDSLAALVEPPGDTSDPIEAHLRAITEYDATELRRQLGALTDGLDSRAVVREYIAPLVLAVGSAWSHGRLEIRHEHFVTQVLVEVLQTLHEDPLETSSPRKAVLATLPGEPHGLGLHMIAVFLRSGGHLPVILGTEVPVEEIARATGETGARAVAVSISSYGGGTRTDSAIRELRQQISGDISIIVGGRGARGARRPIPGVEYLDDFDALEQWTLPQD